MQLNIGLETHISIINHSFQSYFSVYFLKYRSVFITLLYTALNLYLGDKMYSPQITQFLKTRRILFLSTIAEKSELMNLIYNL